MKISYRWLTEHVETKLPPGEVADRLTNAGIAIEQVSAVAQGLSGVVVGQIEAIERDLGPGTAGHHNQLCRVALPDRTFSVVCGAPNVAPGLRAAFAPPGAALPGIGVVKAATIRGVISEGMLCSEKELGLSEDHAGILVLAADAPVGADLVDYLGLDDWIFDVEVMPNRPDTLSVVGVAREIAALTGPPLRSPPIALREGVEETAALASVAIEDPDLCPRYAARVIVGLTVRPSPPWLAQRLRAVGLRPINNLVDVTNYVMWELGQPLHAFDQARLPGGRIVVRRARAGERITTIDGRERPLTPDMLMICDAVRPVAIGGVMGGADTEVTAETTTVLLEAAAFHPASIRRTARALGLHTDAAYRFERGTDVEGLTKALDRAAQLMADLGGGRACRGIVDVYPAPRPRPHVALRLERVQRLIGACPERPHAILILKGLGFEVNDAAPALGIVVPSFRRDVVQEDDLVEEIVRIWGFDKIPVTLASGGTFLPVRRPPTRRLTRAVGQALTAAGLSECLTYSFQDPDRLAAMGWRDPASLLALQNPLSRERSVMRPSLSPGLLEVIATNIHRQMPDVAVFEVGHVFAPHREEDGDRPVHEELWTGIALTGLRAGRVWHAGRARMDCFDAKGMAELALAAAGAPAVETSPWPAGTMPEHLEEGRGARLLYEGHEVGWFGEVTQAVRDRFDVQAPVAVAGVSLTALAALPEVVPRYLPLPRFPAVQRDLAVVLPLGVPAAAVEDAIRAMEVPWLARITLFDLYEGNQVGAGRRSLAWSLTFQAPDRTLTDTEVNEVHARIVKEIARRFDAEIRGT